MVYSVGPDDRVTPKAPAQAFFYDRLVTACAKCFRAAEKAGVKKAVVYNSYFTYFNDLYPEAHLAQNHIYVACRVAQAKLLNEQKKSMEVVVLELPYIFGCMMIFLTYSAAPRKGAPIIRLLNTKSATPIK